MALWYRQKTKGKYIERKALHSVTHFTQNALASSDSAHTLRYHFQLARLTECILPASEKRHDETSAPETMRLAHFALTSLFMFSMVRAFAEPETSLPGPYPAAAQDLGPQAEAQLPTQLEQGRARQLAVPGSGSQSNGNSEQAALAGEGRRQLRLTPEARRALRQQINQARHDIYVLQP
jgi:hypothetical protein